MISLFLCIQYTISHHHNVSQIIEPRDYHNFGRLLYKSCKFPDLFSLKTTSKQFVHLKLNKTHFLLMWEILLMSILKIIQYYKTQCNFIYKVISEVML